MASPSFVAASTGNSDLGGAWTATGVAGATGNIVILQVLQDGSTSGAVTLTSATNIENLAGTDNQWTSIGSFAVGSPTSAYQHLWIGRLINASAPTASGGNTTSEDLFWRFYEFADVSLGTTLATVIENVTAGSTTNTAGTSGTIADASVTTIGADRLALNFVGINDDNLVASFTGETGGDWREVIAEYADSAGNDATIGLQHALYRWGANHPGANNMFALGYGNGYWVTAGSAGALYYLATNPTGTWTSNTQGTSVYYCLAYGNGYWVVAGGSGALRYRATDPTGAWTSNAQGTVSHQKVAYGNGYWVAVGEAGNLYYKASTPDGAWTSNPQGTLAFVDVYYGNGYWVAVGEAGNLYYKASTPDGAWTSNPQGSVYLNGLYYDNGYWVAVGTSGALYYKASTPDGAWTSNAQGSGTFGAVGYGNGYWVAANAGTNRTLRLKASTPDGTWTSVSMPDDAFGTLVYGDGYWGMVRGSASPYAFYFASADGLIGNSVSTIDGGTTANSDATDGWGVVGFALIGTTPAGVKRVFMIEAV